MAARQLIAGICVAAAGLAFAASPAAAKCTKLGFSVNDYGKEGPIRDAKALLDKYIADWAAKNNIKSYRTGKKDVTCELFLDFGIFDEHTCKATATVCWGDSTPAGGVEAKVPADTAGKAVQPAAVKKAPIAKKQEAPQTTGSNPEPVKAPAPAKKKAE